VELSSKCQLGAAALLPEDAWEATPYEHPLLLLLLLLLGSAAGSTCLWSCVR
jgi:hypothetical protein